MDEVAPRCKNLANTCGDTRSTAGCRKAANTICCYSVQVQLTACQQTLK
jgi:hypothetical protein